MSGFSNAWLALREQADHRARSAALAARLAHAFTGRASVTVIDLGCGSGSNLRATYDLLPPQQQWTLVDYDAHLLTAARATLSQWADHAVAVGDRLELAKGAARIAARFRQVDANADLEGALGPTGDDAADLVTASAFFDLCSAAYMQRFARAVAARHARFFTVLTYNGEQSWTPPHAADAAMTTAFHAHQQTDKGFGAAAGPDAARALAEAFRAAGYAVEEADTPWVLGSADQPLIDELAAGYANAVAETGQVPRATIAAWRGVRRTGARVGHTDTFAVPR